MSNGVFNLIAAYDLVDLMLTNTSEYEERQKQILIAKREAMRTIHLKFKTWNTEREMIMRNIDLMPDLARIVAEYAGSSHSRILQRMSALVPRPRNDNIPRTIKAQLRSYRRVLISLLETYGYELTGLDTMQVNDSLWIVINQRRTITDNDVLELLYSIIILLKKKYCDEWPEI